jgi:membrane-associated phospholipid phosphatase
VEILWQWGIDLIIAIQQIHGPTLDSIFRAITFLGEQDFYLILLPLIFWCVNFGLGARLAILFLFSSYVLFGLKDLLQQPRPFDFEPSVELSDAEGYGLPSHHAASAVFLWGGIATWARKTWFWVVAVALIVLISFSRIYLGVHFPTDVLGGWVIGALLLSLYLFGHPSIERWLVKRRLRMQILLAMAVPIVLLTIHPTKGTTTFMGSLAGFGVGLALTRKYVSFNARGAWWQRIIRFLIGAAVVFALYIGFRGLLPNEESVYYLIFYFLQYWLIGLWIGLGGPWLFRLLKLASEADEEA